MSSWNPTTHSCPDFHRLHTLKFTSVLLKSGGETEAYYDCCLYWSQWFVVGLGLIRVPCPLRRIGQCAPDQSPVSNQTQVRFLYFLAYFTFTFEFVIETIYICTAVAFGLAFL